MRDAEWVVGHVERNSISGNVIHAVGLSGIVRDRNVIFVENIEKQRGRGIEVVDPADVVLVADQSSGFADTLLHLEAALRKSAPMRLDPQVAGKAAIDDLDFQLDPVRLALSAPRVRILIGDDVGLGKTLEAGLLASELILRRRARRILVVTSKSMLTQFQQEFWTRFSIPLVKIDSAKIKQIRVSIPLNKNPFDQFDKSIISMDTLKNDTQYRTALERAWWDLIVIDEAHNVAERGGPRGASQRNALAERLASRSDALVLLSATPHDGSRRSFASLMRMLDPTSIADPESYGPDDIQGLFLRRFRTTPAVKQALKSKVQPRSTQKLDFDPSPPEEALYEGLASPHPPGHGQVDFGEALAVIGGVRQKIHFFCLDLPQSDACFVKAYPRETTEAFLDGHGLGLRLLRRRAAVASLRQHQDRGGEDLRRRQARSHPRLHGTGQPLPVPGPLRPPGQGKRQRRSWPGATPSEAWWGGQRR